jgi:hypothetical protein
MERQVAEVGRSDTMANEYVSVTETLKLVFHVEETRGKY